MEEEKKRDEELLRVNLSYKPSAAQRRDSH